MKKKRKKEEERKGGCNELNKSPHVIYSTVDSL